MALKTTNPIIIIATLGLSAGLGPASLTLVTPSLPAIEHALNVSQFLIGISQAVFLFGLAIPQLIFGSLTDRFGHRLPLVVGMISSVLGSSICAVAPDFGWLVIGRLLQAIGASSGIVTSRALMRELYETEKAAAMLGYMTVSIMIIPMLAPIAGGFIQAAVGWRGNFALLSIISVLLVAAVLTFIPNVDSRQSDGRLPVFKAFAQLLSSLNFLFFTWQAILPSFLAQTFFAAVPFVLEQHYHMRPNSYGALFAIPATGFMLGSLLSGRLTVRLGINRMIRVGTFVSFACSLLFLGIYLTGQLSVAWLFFLVGAISMGHGLSVPSATASATSALRSSFGSAAGMLGFLQFSLSGFGVVALIPAAGLGPAAIVWNFFLIGTISMVMVLLVNIRDTN